MATPLVELANVAAFYPGRLPRKTILENISWKIYPGKHCAILGKNGAGKSSLLKLIHGDIWPSKGNIKWRDGKGFSDSPIIGRKLSQLVAPDIQAKFQGSSQAHTVKEFLASTESVVKNQMHQIELLMNELGAEEWLFSQMHELSQGQLRLVLIAAALLHKPALLLLDEWSDGLDEYRFNKVMAKLESVADKITMIFITHNPHNLPKWVQKTYYMEKGQLYAQPKELSNSFTPTLKKTAPPSPEQTSGSIIFELADVSVFIDGKRVLDNLNWRMKRGENWRICGSNGAGKSTFLRLLAGDEFVYAGGKLRFWPLNSHKPAETLTQKRRAISLVSDLTQALYGYALTGLELILSGIDNTVGIYREYASEEIRWAEKLLCEFFPDSSSSMATQSIHRLSCGQLRRLFLCRALASKPEVLLLDEPLSGMDASSTRHYLELLEKLIDKGIDNIKPALVCVSHQPLPEFFNRSGNMKDGKLYNGFSIRPPDYPYFQDFV